MDESEQQESVSRRINAAPTKDFFIYMLTRDVQLSRAIIDLVDNSIDGAQRLRGSERYEGLWVRIEIEGDHFRVTDNCGGIPVEIARNYAFRFGRPKEAKDTPGSVGLFGVGMKRTFFKLGREFSVKSQCKTEGFTMVVDVDSWLEQGSSDRPDDWHFEFATVDEHMSEIVADETGTDIIVRRLLKPVSDSFALETFRSQLLNELSAAHAVSVDRGLALTVNMIPVNFVPQRLFVSDQLKPAFVEKLYPRKEIDGLEGEPVKVRLYAGVADRDLHSGGWYVFCNGRLIVKADQTATTVWGKSNGMRQYHPDFAYFRGFAYFDSVHSSLLPWTTTKTGIDTDSILYKAVQREMIEISKPVISFLSELAAQKNAANQGEWSDPSIEAAIAGAKAERTDSLNPAATFLSPQPQSAPSGPRMQRIQYSKPLADVERARELLKVTSFKDVGEKTFDYYLEYEGGE